MVQWVLVDCYRCAHKLCSNYTLYSYSIDFDGCFFRTQEVDSDADATSSPDLVAPVLVTPKLRKRIWVKALQFAQSLWNTAFRVSFIFTVVAMMVCMLSFLVRNS